MRPIDLKRLKVSESGEGQSLIVMGDLVLMGALQFADPSLGATAPFAANWTAVVLPPLGGIVGHFDFTANPEAYRGDFRFSGPGLQVATSPSETATSVQYVDTA